MQKVGPVLGKQGVAMSSSGRVPEASATVSPPIRVIADSTVHGVAVMRDKQRPNPARWVGAAGRACLLRPLTCTGTRPTL